MSGSPSGQMRQDAESAILPPDPSMQDILASIRRILSEDEAAAAERPAESAAAPLPVPPGVFRLDESMLVRPPKAPPPLAVVEPLPPAEDADAPIEADLVQMILGQTPVAPIHAADDAAPPAAEAAPAPAPPSPAPEEPRAMIPDHQHEPPDLPALDATMPDHAMTQPLPPLPTDLKPLPPDEPLVAAESAAATQSVVAGLMRQLSTERATPVFRAGPTLEDLVREEMRPLLKHWLDTNLPPMVERLVRSELDRLIARAAP